MNQPAQVEAPPFVGPAMPAPKASERWSQQDWECAYSNVRAVPDHQGQIHSWQDRSAAFRLKQTRATEDLSYGEGQREKFDFFLPETRPPRGLIFFVHGGYWRRFDKSYFSFVGEGALARGYAVAIASYSLKLKDKPHVPMGSLVSQVEIALNKAVSHVGGPIYICGHSAGAHLAFMMAREANGLSALVRPRLRHVLGLSGLYDLAYLENTSINQDLKLTAQEVETASPYRLAPMQGPQHSLWVGSKELPEFIRHSRLQAGAWRARYEELPEQDHFSILDALADPHSKVLDVLFD